MPLFLLAGVSPIIVVAAAVLLGAGAHNFGQARAQRHPLSTMRRAPVLAVAFGSALLMAATLIFCATLYVSMAQGNPVPWLNVAGFTWVLGGYTYTRWYAGYICALTDTVDTDTVS